jgi:hypothetical protein
MSITIETLQIPVTFNVTRNKGLVNETSHTVSTTLDFSDYTAEDFMNRAIDSVVIAIQAPLRNPPKSGNALTFSQLEGKTFKAPKPGRSASRKDPVDQMYVYYCKCTLAQRATLPIEIQLYYDAMMDAEAATKKVAALSERKKLEAGEI